MREKLTNRRVLLLIIVLLCISLKPEKLQSYLMLSFSDVYNTFSNLKLIVCRYSEEKENILKELRLLT